jgi:adenosine deaminase
VSLNSDCPLFCSTSANAEYRLAHERLGLDLNALARIARTSIIAGSCPDARQAAALNRLDTWTVAHDLTRKPKHLR